MGSGMFQSQNKWTHYTSGDKQLNSDDILGVTRWNNNEWLLGYYNLCFFNHRTGIFTKAFDDKIINNISNICYDNDRNLWLTITSPMFNAIIILHLLQMQLMRRLQLHFILHSRF